MKQQSESVQIPTVSVVSIAMHEDEFAPLKQALGRQTFRDFEFIGEAGGSIPEAWNRAVKKARGRVLVFTETDARPVSESWLEELVASISDERTIVKGLEVTSSPLDLSNLAIHRSAFETVHFNEAFLWGEDTDLFCHLKEKGFRFLQLEKAAVIHWQKDKSKRMLKRGFRYGLYYARIRHRYADPVDVMGPGTAFRLWAGATLRLAGLLLGWVLYLPDRWKRPQNETVDLQHR